jgi:DNA-directed RNA polymerase subunit RPC12/RpoP
MTARESNWKIEHQCPQCGAPALMDEADRLLACPFCRTRLYLVTPDYFRYRIPAPAAPGKEMLYLPYWRLKGTSLSVEGNEIKSRFIDTSSPAISAPGIPPSLGVRPQAMTLKFASPDMTGRFIDASLPPESVIPAMNASDSGGPVFCRVFIGERISLVYAPAYVENGRIYDALLERPLSDRQEDSLTAFAVKPPNWQVRFVATQCPRCGWDMQGERDVVVLTCRNCDSAWCCSGGRFLEIPFAVLAAAAMDAVVYLPFWRMKPHSDGIALKSYADLIRLANLPKAMNPAFESVPVYFWSPAFKVNPALFLRWCRQMTVYQPGGAIRETFAGAYCHPVTMPAGEARESMIITLAGLIRDKRRIYPMLKDLRIDARETLLVYHPFRVGSRELTHETMQVTLDRTALDYGAYL